MRSIKCCKDKCYSVLSLLYTQYKLFRRRGYFRYLGFGFSGGGLLLLILPLILFILRPYQRLHLAPESFYHFVVELISSTLLLGILIAMTMLVIACPFYGFDWRYRNRMRKKTVE